MPIVDQVREQLKKVVDPEIHLNIVDLGLVYDVAVDEASKVQVNMTLTSPMCPVGPEILSQAHMVVKQLEGVEDVKVDLVWSPPWDPRKMASEDAKAHLGIWDDSDEDSNETEE